MTALLQQTAPKTDIQFPGNDETGQKLRRLVQDIQKIEAALNAAINAINNIDTTPSGNVPPHVLATTAGLDPDHTVTGLTKGQVLKAISATNAAFAKLTFPEMAQTDIVSPTEGDALVFHDGFWSNLPISGGGATGQNLGSGVGVYAATVAGVLNFKSLVPGLCISVSASADSITIAVTNAAALRTFLGYVPINTQNSVVGDGSPGTPVEFENDLLSPGNDQVYGTDGGGVKGWKPNPGSTLTVTDGTTSVTPVSTIKVIGATVTNPTAGEADITITGGGNTLAIYEGSNPYNVNPDTHSIIPAGIGVGPDDEFESGSAIDLTGARYSGATPWSLFNGGPASASVGQGALKQLSAAGGPSTQGYSQPIVGGTWEYTCKINNNNNANIIGMTISVSGTTQTTILVFSNAIYVQHRTSPTAFVSNPAGPFAIGSVSWVYLRISFDGTNLFYEYSLTGYESDFIQIYTETPAAFLGSNPTLIVLNVDSNGSGVAIGEWDWFRATPSPDFIVAAQPVPGSIPDLACWFEFDNLSQSAGKTVAGIFDRTPATPSMRGTNGGSGLVIGSQINSLNTVLWPNGSASGKMNLFPPVPVSGGVTYFLVVNPASGASTQALCGSAAAHSLPLYLGIGSPNLVLVDGLTGVIATSSVAWTAGTPFQANVTYDPSTGNWAFRQSQAAANSGTGSAGVGAAPLDQFGSDDNLEFLVTTTIAAFLVYNRVLTPTEVLTLEAYFHNKWGV